MKKSIYYYLKGNGDGSASAHFFEDKECAEIFMNFDTEPFGDNCISSIDIKTDGKNITFDDNDVMSREKFISDLESGEFYFAEDSDVETALKQLKTKN